MIASLPCGSRIFRVTLPIVLDQYNIPSCPLYAQKEMVLDGDKAQVTKRKFTIVGMFERNFYPDGVKFPDNPFFSMDSSIPRNSFNVYSMKISDPPHEYFLNGLKTISGSPTVDCWRYDCEVEARGGAVLTLQANSQDGFQLSAPGISCNGGTPVATPFLPPFAPFIYGQWIGILLGKGAGCGCGG